MSASPRRKLATTAIAVAALWILAGALFKLFRGTPKDLPQLVRDLPLALGLTYKLVISAELAVALVALLRPRWGWPLVVLLLLVFDAVLTQQIAAGEESCGCFGQDFPIPPWGMLVIDTALLAFVVLTRPWSARLGRGAPLAVLAVALAVAIGGAWLVDRQLPDDPAGGGEPTLTPLGQWVELDLASWVGKDLAETPLARWLDVYQYWPDALWVLWRQTCEHCAEHLAHLALTETGERSLVLLQLEEEHDTEANRVVHSLPQGDFVLQASLPDTVDYVVTTPAEMEVVEWKVVSAAEGVGPEGHAGE